MSFVTKGCLFRCGDDHSQSVVHALKESSQTAVLQKAQNKQNINFQINRIELGPKQPEKYMTELRSKKIGKKISIKGLLNSLELNRGSNSDPNKNSQISSEWDSRPQRVHFNALLSKTYQEEQVQANNQHSLKLWKSSRKLKKHETISYTHEINIDTLTLDLQKNQYCNHKNQSQNSLKLGADLLTVRSYEQKTHRYKQQVNRIDLR